MKFKIGDIVRIKKRDNPNYDVPQVLHIDNIPKRIVGTNGNMRTVKIEPSMEVYIWSTESNKWMFSNYNDLLGIDTLEHAVLFQLDNELFEI